MKNIIIAVIVLILIGGGLYLLGKKEAVAPEENMESTENTTNNTNETTNTVGGTVNTGVTVDVQPPVITTQPGVTTKTFTISGNNFAFDVKTIEVNKGEKVRIIFKNSGGNHDWRIDEFNAGTKVIGGGKEETIEFIANKAGSFEYYCSVGSHRAMGMKGTLVVK